MPVFIRPAKVEVTPSGGGGVARILLVLGCCAAAAALHAVIGGVLLAAGVAVVLANVAGIWATVRMVRYGALRRPGAVPAAPWQARELAAAAPLAIEPVRTIPGVVLATVDERAEAANGSRR
jgi:hypothetical protein